MARSDSRVGPYPSTTLPLLPPPLPPPSLSPPGRFIPLKYGTGTTFVSYAEDSVTVANETVEGVKFGEVVYQPSPYHLKTKVDGFLGLSFPLHAYPDGTIW